MSLNVMQATLGYHPQQGPQTPKKFLQKISSPYINSIDALYI
jgi:hypothetical protein